ncbi:hypothetical protein HMPREF1248_0159 [Coriobacteriaceae bacterium BV3Ac1]|nr:hypothetical protein HMPREF1248_0159 [Coriobacteriaceae bacterium BV3Ac1]
MISSSRESAAYHTGCASFKRTYFLALTYTQFLPLLSLM